MAARCRPQAPGGLRISGGPCLHTSLPLLCSDVIWCIHSTRFVSTLVLCHTTQAAALASEIDALRCATPGSLHRSAASPSHITACSAEMDRLREDLADSRVR